MRTCREMPTRAEFTALWNNRTMTMEDIAMRWHASRSFVMSWAQRFGLPPRPACRPSKRRYRMPVLVLHPADNHCLPIDDGPGPSDPTPEQIAARAEELRQAHYAQRRAANY